MSLRSLQKSWDRLGATDPFWAILSDPKKKHNGWDREEFFRTGAAEVAHILAWVERVHPLPAKTRALDFGCGVGRLSQPLSDIFEEVRGVDISPSMLELARKFNRYGERCRYTLNDSSDLRIFPDGHFDFIYSNITLQHIEPQFTRLYLAEFGRVLKPGGVLVFQLPSMYRKHTSWLDRMGRWIYHAIYLHLLRFRAGTIEMYGIERAEVVRILEASRVELVDVVPDESAGSKWESFRYMGAGKPLVQDCSKWPKQR